jgi:hypothetical protein
MEGFDLTTVSPQAETIPGHFDLCIMFVNATVGVNREAFHF